MKKIYLIKVRTIYYNRKTTNEVLWAVNNKEVAKRDCKQLQIDHNKNNYQSFHDIYYYEEIKFYEYE